MNIYKIQTLPLWKSNTDGITVSGGGKTYYIRAETLTDALVMVPEGTPEKGELWIGEVIIGLDTK